MARIAAFEGDFIIFLMEDGKKVSIVKSLCDFVPRLGMEVDLKQENGRYTLTPSDAGSLAASLPPSRKIGEIKALARNRIRGNKLNLLPLVLLLFSGMALSVCCSGLHLLLLVFLYPCIEKGSIHIFFDLFEGKKGSMERLSSGFKPYWRTIGLALMRWFYLGLWSLLFVIPGFIKSLSYSQAMYILADNPEMEANDAITQSRKLMGGHKWRFFLLCLSFFGWWILCVVTFGFALVYVHPYWQESKAIFYRSLKG